MGQQRYEKKIKEMAEYAPTARMICDGLSPEEMADVLGYSVAKVNMQIRGCYIKAGVRNRAKFTAIFFQELLANE